MNQKSDKFIWSSQGSLEIKWAIPLTQLGYSNLEREVNLPEAEIDGIKYLAGAGFWNDQKNGYVAIRARVVLTPRDTVVTEGIYCIGDSFKELIDGGYDGLFSPADVVLNNRRYDGHLILEDEKLYNHIHMESAFRGISKKEIVKWKGIK